MNHKFLSIADGGDDESDNVAIAMIAVHKLLRCNNEFRNELNARADLPLTVACTPGWMDKEQASWRYECTERGTLVEEITTEVRVVVVTSLKECRLVSPKVFGPPLPRSGMPNG